MFRNVAVAVLCCLALAASAWGQSKVVTLKDGKQIIGEVTEMKNAYQIKLKSGIIAIYAKSDVAKIEEETSPKQEFEQRLAKLDPASADQHYALGEWAFGKGMYEEAQKVLQKALKIDAAHTKSKLLLVQVEAQLKLSGEPDTRPVRPPITTTKGADANATVLAEWLLSDEDINRIRLEELRKGEKVTVQFRNDADRKFIDMMRGKGDFEDARFEKRFLGFAPWDKAHYMLKHLDRDNVAMKDEIRIKTNPQFMVEFNSRVWPKLRQTCASVQCHGGEKPEGTLRFFPLARNDKVDYTNFVILVGYRKDGRRLIDRNNPEESLFLNFGLPPDQARSGYVHQQKITPLFAKRTDDDYKRVLEWIDSLEGPPYPDYRLLWKPPLGMKIDTGGPDFLTTQPASTPTPAPTPTPSPTSAPAPTTTPAPETPRT
jgi:tetratricopeptide (TPR) repeat protein